MNNDLLVESMRWYLYPQNFVILQSFQVLL